MNKGMLGPIVVFGAGVIFILVCMGLINIEIASKIAKATEIPYESLNTPLLIIFASCLIIGFPLLLYGLTYLKALRKHPKVKSR